MATDGDGSDPLEKTNIVRRDTLKIKVDPNYKVPPCLVLMVGPPEYMGRQWLLEKENIIIGRTLGSDIQVPEPSLSKSHAKIEIKGSRVSVIDLGATNTTMVNEQVLTPNQSHALKNNDQIKTGNLVFKFLERGILSETSEKERMQSELETARSVQETLLPSTNEARYQWVQIGGRYRSASECGGDWWWHWSVGDRAFAILGDATGHGAAAALITSAARSAMAAIEDDVTCGVERVYTTLSNAIHKCTGGNLAMSAFIVEVNLTNKKMRYINASHLPAVMLPLQNTPLKWNGLDIILEPVSPTLGSMRPAFMVGERDVQEGTRLVLLTDGLTERKDTLGQALRERPFNNMLIETHLAHLGSQKNFLEELFTKSDQVAQFAPQDDDITVVCFDF